MRCLLCNSRRVLKFIDAFGEKRVFCKTCGRSFLETTVIRFKNQTNLLEFNSDTYSRGIAPRLR
ncbi:MAG: hypothetical protein ACP5O8_03735 [Candidatus Aenigmatarchaeota archaeon]